MIKQVAEAIAAKYAPAVDHRAPYAKVMLMEAARAVILAMREPTDQMCAAGRYAEDESMDAIWRAMIDAAMKEGKT